MPSSFTSNVAFEKPADGEQTGSWGDTVNDNMDIVDRLTSQVGSIALLSSTYTLTTSTSGALSEGHYSAIKFTGTPGATCTVTINPNTIQRIYTIYNNTNQTVIMAQGSGSTVSIPAGEVSQVYSDGAGAAAAVTPFTDKLKDVLYSGDIGSTVQGYDADLTALGALAKTDGNFIVGNGSTWVAESGNTVLQSIGVTATTTELNYVDGVTSNIQTQLNTLTSNKADKTTSISAGAGLTGGGNLSTNRTISHADTSSQSSVNNSGSTFIQDITLDTYGHVTGIGSATISFPAPTTAQVLSATAGANAGDVGTYALCWPVVSTLRNEGTSIAGSSLRYASTFAYGNVGYSSRVPAGTWRCMGVTGYLDGSSGYGFQSDKQTTVWLRIA